MKNLYWLGAVVVLLLAYGCSGITKVTDTFTNPTAREVYAREYKNNETVFGLWNAAYEAALNDSLAIAVPYGEKGTFNPGEAIAYSYNLQLAEGEVLLGEVIKDSLLQRVFIDVFKKKDATFEKVASNEPGASSVTFAAKTGGTYKVIMQPEINATSNFFISLTTKPLYPVFPVAGKGNEAIGSFWGMERDGGKRSHEGIDIFAKRGTPVVAVAEGYITYTGERGLGGKQVWLRDSDFGSSLYYAHLDDIAVNSGIRVKVGDTLGYIGNTGNAKFTPPHLHFGIYRNYGAVNPLPFVFETTDISAKSYAKSFNVNSLKIKSTMANLRLAPDAKSGKVGQLKANDVVTLLGQNKDWLHVQTAAKQKAYLHKSLVKEL